MSAAPGARPDPEPAGDPPANGESFAAQRAEVIAALGRLAEGTFARCDICGVQISDRRLRLAPAANRCMSHLLSDTTGSSNSTNSSDDGNDDDHYPC